MSKTAIWRNDEHGVEAAILMGKERTGSYRYWIETRPFEDKRITGYNFKEIGNAIDILRAMGYSFKEEK